MPTMIRQLSREILVCVVLLCVVSIILLNIRTTDIYQVFTSVLFRNDSNFLTVRVTTTTTKPLETIRTTTFPNELVHDWNDKDRDALAIYILSAISFNTKTRKGFKADIKLTGWVAKRHKEAEIKCCILLTSGDIVKVNENSKVRGSRGLKLTAHQYECHVNTHTDNVRGVTLQLDELECPQNKSIYIKPFIPKKVTTEESFAICLKILYEQVDNVKLKDWLEYYKGIGVDQVFMYTYNISQATRNVLRQYINLGFVEKRPFAYPWSSTRHIGEKKATVWEDEQVVVYDCLKRLSGYKYMAIVDLDEFLVPRKHEDVKTMMKYLMKIYPKAGGFQLSSYIFDKDVRPDSNITANLPEFMLYFKRTPGLRGLHSRNKNIVLPSRTTVRGYHTHRFQTKPGYSKIVMNETVATINHYRHCYSNLNETCSQLTTDTFMLKFYTNVQNNTELSLNKTSIIRPIL